MFFRRPSSHSAYPPKPVRPLRLESLEKRELMASDTMPVGPPLATTLPAVVSTPFPIDVRLPERVWLVRDLHEAVDEGGPQRVPHWAAFIIEANSGVTPPRGHYELTTDRPELFSQLPSIDSEGTLLYTPAPNVVGTAIVMAKFVRDESHVSNQRTFTINIIKPHPFYNAANPLDVTNDGAVAPNDALAVIDYLNGRAAVAPNVFVMSPYYDVSGDGLVSPSDALIVINHFNAPVAMDLSGDLQGEPPGVDDALDLLALDATGAAQRRRRF